MRVSSHHSGTLILSGLRVVVQRNADSPSVMSVILADDRLAAQLPQSRVVIATCRYQVRRVGAECTVPDPALVARQRGL